MTPPDVSVVIPTWKRETRLAFALDALAEQTLSQGRFEVVVVRSAEGEEPDQVDAPQGRSVRFLTCPTAGAAAQRNVGWRSAQAPLVAFMDDDCRPSREWLAEILAQQDGDGSVLQGRTSPDPDETHLLGGLARSLEVDAGEGWYPTCNIAYPRELLEQLDGFDEIFPGAFGEDTDLALRARRLGRRVIFVPAAVVWHAVHARTLRDALRDARRATVIPFVLKRHPEQREALVLGVFFNWRHARITMALAGLALARQNRLLGLAMALPYVNRNVVWQGSPLRLARAFLALPARGVADLAEVSVVLFSAARHRVVVI